MKMPPMLLPVGSGIHPGASLPALSATGTVFAAGVAELWLPSTLSAPKVAASLNLQLGPRLPPCGTATSCVQAAAASSRMHAVVFKLEFLRFLLSPVF
jgi:hypothetical protein